MRRLLRHFRPREAVTEVSYAVRSCSRTHLGRVRQINEDRVLDRPDLGLWAVADGMGGHSRGDVAAETVIAHLSALRPPVTARTLDEAIQSANREIYEAHGGRSGTTLVMLSLDDGAATIRWAGDSRAYLIRNGNLRLLTRDHSVVQELVEAGVMDAAHAADHPQANVITRALGTGPQLTIETLSVPLAAGDRVLLCSDGLSRTLANDDLQSRCEVDDMADRLLQNALQRNASDNISLVIVEGLGGQTC